MTETATRNAVFKVHIRASIEEVWNEVTRKGEVLPFFFGSVMDTPGLQPGAPIRMRTPSGKYTGVVGDVVDFDPPHRFSHTFRFTHVDDPPCTVVYELQESGDGVDFTLIVEDMPVGTKTEKSMSQGGNFIVKTLKAVLETGKPAFSTRLILLMIKLTEPFSPKKCRSENWP